MKLTNKARDIKIRFTEFDEFILNKQFWEDTTILRTIMRTITLEITLRIFQQLEEGIK